MTAPGHEHSDVQPRKVLLATGLLLAGILVSLALVAGLFAVLEKVKRQPDRTALETSQQVPPSPRLQVSPPDDRLAIEARARAMLEGYAWADRSAGRVRIPIERAMEMVARKGWPDPDPDPEPGPAR
jgi:hypothetical protein